MDNEIAKVNIGDTYAKNQSDKNNSTKHKKK